jgi:hypothetical protein
MTSGGCFVLQVLNFSLIKKRDERIINITDDYENVYIRFYDLLEDHINFNILKYSKLNYKDRVLQTTKLFDYSFKKIEQALIDSGFGEIETFGSYKFDKFDIESSKDLIVSAKIRKG